MGQFTYDANWINSERVSRIKSWAYITQFKPPGDCWLITFIHNQTQGTPGANFNIKFEFSFDGQPKPPVAPDVLNGLTL
jgi:LPS-assembly protein